MTHSRKEIRFPPLSSADEDGLLMVGGGLNEAWLTEAYRRGIFPWPLVDGALEILAWFSPDPRAIIPLGSYHIPRRLRRRLRRGEFELTINRCFPEVLHQCADRSEGTWITSSLTQAYVQLHRQGRAHSIEAWQEGRLVGGLYGVAFGGFFSAESMFHHQRDASKACLAALLAQLASRGFQLLDIQQSSSHCEQMGAVEISRRRFLTRLRTAWNADVTFGTRLEITYSS